LHLSTFCLFKILFINQKKAFFLKVGSGKIQPKYKPIISSEKNKEIDEL